MLEFSKPIIVSSKCIEFDACRYDGAMIKSHFVDKLKKYVEFFTVCPEVEIGLGIPRDPIRLLQDNDQIKLFQPSTGIDLTEKMKDFADKFLSSLPLVDGFLFKNKSPSCGIKAVRVYSGPGKSSSRRDGVGAFTREVFQRFYQLPVEDEGRLRNFIIREDFLSRIFTLSSYRKILEEGDFQDLVEFHTKNKLLIMAHSQIYSKELGRAISNRHEKPLEDIKHEYGQILLKTLSQPSQPSSNINVLQHAFGYFSKHLTHEEKDLFFDSIQKYRQGRYPLLISQNLLRSWIIRFKDEYLSSQTFLQPYPEDLMEITMI